MFKKIFVFISVLTLLINVAVEEALARAGGRSSFGGGRSSTSYSSQGSRGSRTFQGGGNGSKNYAPMERSTAQNANRNNANPNAANPQNQQAQPSPAGNFFQRNPFLTTVGAVLAGSWLGHMLFGSSGLGAMGANAGGGFMLNLIMMVLGAFVVMALVRFLTNRKSCANTQSFGNNNAQNYGANFAQVPPVNAVNINLSEGEKVKFSQNLIEVQKAWSNQDIEALRRLTTPEMLQYFSDSLRQNTSQGIANKIEDIDVTMIDLSESWREGELEYATAIIEWSCFDYMVNLNKNPSDSDYIVEGGDKNLVMVSEAWTFVRYGSSGNWILSAIAQMQ